MGSETETVEPIQSSRERIEDVCFQGLIKKYTDLKEFKVVEMINLLYGKVLVDRELGR